MDKAQGEIVVSLGEIGLLLDRGAIGRYGFLPLIVGAQRIGEIVVRLRKIGLQGDSTAESGNGFRAVSAPPSKQCLSETETRPIVDRC